MRTIPSKTSNFHGIRDRIPAGENFREPSRIFRWNFSRLLASLVNGAALLRAPKNAETFLQLGALSAEF